jgi:hypothetical protein
MQVRIKKTVLHGWRGEYNYENRNEFTITNEQKGSVSNGSSDDGHRNDRDN